MGSFESKSPVSYALTRAPVVRERTAAIDPESVWYESTELPAPGITARGSDDTYAASRTARATTCADRAAEHGRRLTAIVAHLRSHSPRFYQDLSRRFRSREAVSKDWKTDPTGRLGSDLWREIRRTELRLFGDNVLKRENL